MYSHFIIYKDIFLYTPGISRISKFGVQILKQIFYFKIQSKLYSQTSNDTSKWWFAMMCTRSVKIKQFNYQEKYNLHFLKEWFLTKVLRICKNKVRIHSMQIYRMIAIFLAANKSSVNGCVQIITSVKLAEWLWRNKAGLMK